MSLTHHDGVSVYGSGLAFGKKNLEQVIVDCSGYTTSSLHIRPRSLDQVVALGATTNIRFDGGSMGVSGAVLSVSTRLSSIITAQATIGRPLVSGLISVAIVASGHCFDIKTYTDLGGACSISAPINYFLAGI